MFSEFKGTPTSTDLLKFNLAKLIKKLLMRVMICYLLYRQINILNFSTYKVLRVIFYWLLFNVQSLKKDNWLVSFHIIKARFVAMGL